MWEDRLDTDDACEEYRILAADTVSGPGLAVWRGEESLAANNPAHWSTRGQGLAAISPEYAAAFIARHPAAFAATAFVSELDVDEVDDEPEGPYAPYLGPRPASTLLAFVDEFDDADLRQRAAILARGLDDPAPDTFDLAMNSRNTPPALTFASGLTIPLDPPPAGYSDVPCAQCKVALTNGEAADGERICAVCERERRYVTDRIQACDDGTPSLYDPESGALYEASGVSFATDDPEMAVTIKRIDVPHAWRGKGIGSALLRVGCDDADGSGITLDLEVGAAPSGSLDNAALAAWYARYGFVDTTIPGTTGRWMVRTPNQ